MVKNKKITVVLPAYNASKTLEQTINELPMDIIDEIILTDDFSEDETVDLAKTIGIKHIVLHDKNKGYGANQKSCYKKALELDSDIIVLLHPDYQYTPLLIESMVYIIANNIYPIVLGSRMLGNGALKGGMPYYKYISNRFLTFLQNLLLRSNLSEFHTGFRAFSSDILLKYDLESLSDGFIFDNELLALFIYNGHEIAEITCPTRYDENSSNIDFYNSLLYGLGVLKVSIKFFLSKKISIKTKMFG